ncbi:MAG: DUF2283 domain-containing protein [candidate division Zixibacteria bacterium]|nr:DUF2283 domain-containing protein [candidate division Zixibacteria bacterium]
MAKVKEFDVSVVPCLLKFNQKHYWVDYDEATDTLYISFRKPQCADDSIMKENIIYHYDGKKLVGVTILHAKKLKKK